MACSVYSFLVCYACGFKFEHDMPVFRSTVCPECGADVRVCKNCLFYSPGAHWDCRETIAEPVTDKERANFCDHFRLDPSVSHEEGRQTKRKQARSDFDKLFS